MWSLQSDTVTYIIQYNPVGYLFNINTTVTCKCYCYHLTPFDTVTYLLQHSHVGWMSLLYYVRYYIVFLSLLYRGTERVQKQYNVKTYFFRCGVLPILKVESTSCASRIKFVRRPMGGTNMSSSWLRNDTFHVRKISLASAITNEQRLLSSVVVGLLQRLFSVPI